MQRLGFCFTRFWTQRGIKYRERYTVASQKVENFLEYVVFPKPILSGGL